MVANPACGQLNRENEYCPLRLRIWSCEIGLVVPSRASLFTVHTQAEPGSSSWKLETRISSFIRLNGARTLNPGYTCTTTIQMMPIAAR